MTVEKTSDASIVVQKYGGSSVADADRIKTVARRVSATRDEGHRVVVVVSAMGDTTDELLGFARQMSEAPPRRELDMLLTAGERISMALLSMALSELGVPAISFTGSQSGIITNDAHAGARIVEVRPFRLQDELERGKVVIVAGYQGVSYKKEVTTLGRGGSDTTAVALAAALGAKWCEICSDVEGVHTADPRVVDKATLLSEVSHEEMLVLAETGAKVLHSAAVEYARQAGITLWARAAGSAPSELGAGDGTLVRVAGPDAPRRVAGVAERDVCMVRLPPIGKAADLGRFVTLLSTMGVDPKWLVWPGDQDGCTAILPVDDIHDRLGLTSAVEDAFPGTNIYFDLRGVSIVGTGLDTDPRILKLALLACDEADAHPIHMERTSLRLTIVVEAERSSELVKLLHEKLIE